VEERLEEIKKANIEKFVINLRDELHQLWDECYYSEQQRNAFTPLHSTNFNEELLAEHEETQARRMKEYNTPSMPTYSERWPQRQEVWN
jgi:Ase1/PRC1/MAP65 family protein